ncbi:protein kinase [Streptomyces sp. NPDC048565]|uniref:protein kinase domain-containing protein n=1 Tax=Streptomyces sp. NPDC048565 TaxID=3155266 RepID=UPI00343649EB
MTSNGVEEIGGRYLLVERLASGGMGTVWRATDRLLERSVAVKEVHLHGDGEGLSRRLHRAHREARAIARVSHPNVINIHDLVIHDERLWLVMELVRGPSLAEHVTRQGPLSVQRVAEIGLELVAALNMVHSVGVLHRDVKPANVLLRSDGRVVLCDFGIVMLEDTLALTAAGGVVGTVDYLAPERIEGRHAGVPSDLFSLGGTLCALFTGRSPFARANPAATIYAVVSDPPLLPEAAGPLRPILAAMLAKDPAARPSPDEIAAALRPLAAMPAPPPDESVASLRPPPAVIVPTQPSEKPPMPSETPSREKDRRHIRVRAGWLVAAAVLVVGGVVTGLLINHASESQQDKSDAKPSVQPGPSDSAKSDPGRSDGLKAGPTEIGAVMVQERDSPRVWLFSGNQYMRASISESDTGELVTRKENTPRSLTHWDGTFKDLPGFRDHIDAVLPVPGHSGDYWVFSGKQYIRVHLSANFTDSLVSGPAPLDDWNEAFCGASDFTDGIDAVLPAPKPEHTQTAWVFAGNHYIRMKLDDTGPGGSCDVERKQLSNWSGSLAKYENFSTKIDAAMIVPGFTDEVWVFSGREYLRIKLDGANYGDDTAVGAPMQLPDWNTLPQA